MSKQNPFKLPTEPKNDLDLLKWVIFEGEESIKAYEQRLNKGVSNKWTIRKRNAWIILRYCRYIALLIILLWLFTGLVIVSIDLPNSILNNYLQVETYNSILFQQVDVQKLNFFERYILWVIHHYKGMALGMILGMILGFVEGLTLGLSGGLGGSLNSALFGSLFLTFADNLISSFNNDFPLMFAVSLSLSLNLGLTGGFAGGFLGGFGGNWLKNWLGSWSEDLTGALILGLFINLILTLTGAWAGSWTWGLTGGLTFTIGYYFIGGRIFLFPFAYFFPYKLNNNLYLKDRNIWFLPNFINHQFIQQAYQEPSTALVFGEFLFKHRPLQQTLAYQVSHAGQAGFWASQPLNYEHFQLVELTEKAQKHQYEPEFIAAFQICYQALVEEGKETNAHQKIALFKQFQASLVRLYRLSLQERRVWGRYYVEALALWQEKAAARLKQLEFEAKQEYPFGQNPYQHGQALTPKHNQSVFLGREDLRNDLTHTIQTSQSMPMLLIQGQRRVGKTSLLKFLPSILGSQFITIYLDLQGDIQHIPDFLQKLRQAFNERLHLTEETEWQASNNWQQSWLELRHYFEANRQDTSRIIFALDEYEELQDHLRADLPQAKRLLGAMRNFSQHQQHIVFLFTGLAFFTDMRQPDWGEFFVNAKHFEVDYLPESTVNELVSIGGLAYEEEAKAQLFHFTQGHPSLTQEICYHAFEQATLKNEAKVSKETINRLVEQHILVLKNFPIRTFINGFCQDTLSKEMALAIAENDQRKITAWLSDNQTKGKFLRFEQYRFIVQTDSGFRYRSPLFQLYIEKFGIAL